MILSLFLICIGYFIGAIPTGYLVARAVGINDITTHGSGSSGATNVARIAGMQFFLLVLVIDVLKAYFFIWALQTYGYSLEVVCLSAVALLIGNGWSLFLRGKGGKGVATTLGILLALQPLLLYGLSFIWLLSFIITNNVGISSVVGFICLPLLAYYATSQTVVVLLMLFISCWGLWRHASNIRNYFLQ